MPNQAPRGERPSDDHPQEPEFQPKRGNLEGGTGSTAETLARAWKNPSFKGLQRRPGNRDDQEEIFLRDLRESKKEIEESERKDGIKLQPRNESIAFEEEYYLYYCQLLQG